MIGNLYEVVIVRNPLPMDARDHGAKTEVLSGPILLVACDKNSAALKAGTEFTIPEGKGELEVVVVLKHEGE